jgi:hypothetical protein
LLHVGRMRLLAIQLTTILFLPLAFGCGEGDDDDDDRGGDLADDNGGDDENGGDDDGGFDGIPSGFPQLGQGERARAEWAIDLSGFENIPNQEVSSVDELPVSIGAAEQGAAWDDSYDAFALTTYDPASNQFMTIFLPTLEPGTYEVSGFNGEVLYTERDSYFYTTAIVGGRGTVEVAGNDGRAVWGRFSGRVCFLDTPGSNCFSFYEGRFSAAVETEGESLAVEVPADFPPLNPRWTSHGQWRLDTSGYESIPNPVVSSVSDLEESDGAETYAAIWDPSYQRYLLSFADAARDQRFDIHIAGPPPGSGERALQPGVYDLGGADGSIEYTERGGYRYITDISGGRATLEIVSSDGEVLWGTFSGRVCFASTPDANCRSFYEGRFSALDQSVPF